MNLAELGWSPFFSDALEPYTAQGLSPGRVAAQHRGAYVLLGETDEFRAELSGRLFGTAAPGQLPVVGDWVAQRPLPGEARAVIEAVLPRRTSFSRKTASHRTAEQVVAANVDTVFLVTSLGRDLNLRRLERYLTLAWESGGEPAIVLTKSDLFPEKALAALLEVEAIALGVPVHVVSSVTGAGLTGLSGHLGPGRTVALLGSSGVGKSTLVNRLCGHDRLKTADLRADGRGRHTTTHRELVLVPGGGLLLDTPGMRELQLWVSGESGAQHDSPLEQGFGDVAELAAVCRFRDCAHDGEPGCAVRDALERGTLDPARLESFRKLERELAALAIRQDKALSAAARKQRRRDARGRRSVSY